MTAPTAESFSAWLEQNQSHLATVLSGVRASLERHPEQPETEPGATLFNEAERMAASMLSPPALDVLSRIFALSPFERLVVALCAGVELDGKIAPLCAEAQGDPRRAYATFSLALGALRGAHWSAVSPAAPLRQFHLVELREGDGIVRSPLRIDERVLGFLTGVDCLDERLAGAVERVTRGPLLTPSQMPVVAQVERTFRRGDVVQVIGGDPDGRHGVVAALGASLGSSVLRVMLRAVSGAFDEAIFARLLHREALLSKSLVWIDAEGIEASSTTHSALVSRVLERLPLPVVLTSRAAWDFHGRASANFEVRKATAAEQRTLWARALVGIGGEALARDATLLDALTACFDVGARTIEAACADAQVRSGGGEAAFRKAVWSSCCRATRGGFEGVAQRVDGRALWDDLVLPAKEITALRALLTHARERTRVYGAWGFGEKYSSGLGVCAIFAGQSGTGKTMAAEVIAGELGVDLYRVDLSQVVSKYIGETEKNLRRVFDAAEGGGAVLLFDEADALFGKRTEVKDSHDRYANIEVSYLLQRMEAYRGVSVLTTNLRGALDSAFLRRVRFVVTFPFPGEPEREHIWRRVFPAQTPIEDIDYKRLAKIDVTGGNIRNIALGAAFLAAEEGGVVRMEHVLRAAEMEFEKLERSWSGNAAVRAGR